MTKLIVLLVLLFGVIVSFVNGMILGFGLEVKNGWYVVGLCFIVPGLLRMAIDAVNEEMK